MSAPRIRGGRGRITGQDSRVLRSRDLETRAKRARDEISVDQLYIGPWGAYGGDVTNNSGYGQELRLAVLPQVRSEIRVSHARLRVTTAAARQWVCCALYRHDIRGDSRETMHKVAGTDALFFTNSTGVQTIRLETKNAEPILSPSSTYFLGAYVSHTDIEIVSYANTSSRVVAVNVYPMNAFQRTPDSVPVKGLTKHYSRYVPWIVYFSKSGNQLL